MRFLTEMSRLTVKLNDDDGGSLCDDDRDGAITEDDVFAAIIMSRYLSHQQAETLKTKKRSHLTSVCVT